MSQVNENEIKRRFEQISKFQTSPEVLARDLEKAKKDILKLTQNHNVLTNIIWRIIIKSNITKVAAAAAIIVGLLLFSYFNDGKLDLASTAFAQMTENMNKMLWLHAIAETDNSGNKESFEVWLSVESQIYAMKRSSGIVIYYNKDLQSQYDPESNTITITHSTMNDLQNVGSINDYWENMIKLISEPDTKIIQEENENKNRKTTIYKVNSPKFASPMEIKLTVDTARNLPIFFNQKAFDENGNITTEGNSSLDYPETGPEGIYELGVPRDARVVEEKETIWLKGHIIDKNKKPLEGFIEWSYGDVQKTDEKGEFIISSGSRQKPTGTRVCYAYSKDKKLGRGFLWEYKEEPNDFEIVVEPLVTITGQVVDIKGKGIGDVTPYIEVTFGKSGSIRSSENEWETTIDKNGDFKFKGVPVGLFMRIFVSKPGFQGWTDLPLLKAGETFDAGEVILKPLSGYEEKTDWTGVLTGTVTNEDGKPMRGLRVHTQPGGEYIDTTTNKKGQYTLKGLPKGKKISGGVYADGYGHTMFNAVVDGNDLNIQIFPQGWNLLNKKAPGLFVGKWLNTEPVELEQYQGKVVLLQLGVYLPNYLNDFERLEKIMKKYSPDKIQVIIVHQKLFDEYGVSEDDIDEFIKKHNIKWPFCIDDSSDRVRDMNPPRLIGNGAMYSLYDVKATPALYLIDKKGILRISPTPDNLDQWIKKLIAE